MIRRVELLKLFYASDAFLAFTPVEMPLIHWYHGFLLLSLLLGAAALYLWLSAPPSAETKSPPVPPPVRRRQGRRTLIDVNPSHTQTNAVTLADVLLQNQAIARLKVQKTSAKMPPQQVLITSLPFTLGRADCDLTIDEPHVSRKHAKIVRHGDQFFLVDLKSSNHTFLAGKPLRPGELTPLRPNSTIKLGRHTVLRFEC